MSTANHTIQLDELNVAYRLIKRRFHRSITLSVHAGGRVVVTVPKRTAGEAVTNFLNEKKEWLKEALRIARIQQPSFDADRAHYKRYKEHARSLILSRLVTLNASYGFSYGSVRIRMNSTRWGSCSSKGNLNFDYRILFLPEELRDYLLVHELCHLKELNHSIRFWNLVAQHIPDHARIRRELKKIERNGITL